MTVARAMGASGRGRLAPRLFTVGAGACDAAAGLGLLVAPDLVLRLLALPAPVGDRFALRFLGVFVASVGFAYLYPFLGPAGPRREARLAAVIELTAGVRLAVALFLGCAVLAGRPPGWLLVGFTDAAFGLGQLALARRGFFRDGA